MNVLKRLFNIRTSFTLFSLMLLIGLATLKGASFMFSIGQENGESSGTLFIFKQDKTISFLCLAYCAMSILPLLRQIYYFLTQQTNREEYDHEPYTGQLNYD